MDNASFNWCEIPPFEYYTVLCSIFWNFLLIQVAINESKLLKGREAWREIKESPAHKTRCNGMQTLDNSGDGNAQ